MGARYGAHGFEVAGCAARTLAERWGTPLMVIDEDHFRSRCRAVRRAFPRGAFAVKAFPVRTIIRLAVEEHLDLLAASDGELAACLRAGADPRRVWLHGLNKSDRTLEMAVASSISLVILDDPEDALRLADVARVHGVRQDVLLRVVPGVGGAAHPSIDTGHVGARFGVQEARVLETVRSIARSPFLRFRGLHVHLGSQVLSETPFLQAVDMALGTAAAIHRSERMRTRLLDVGGGLGVTYTTEAEIDPERLAPRLHERIRVAAEERRIEVPELMAEPGRWLIANAGITLYEVGQIKQLADGRVVVAVDGGMSDNLRPALYGAEHAFLATGSDRATETQRVDIVGSHCESGDVLARGVLMPRSLRRGDIVAAAGTGAYSYALANNYNRVGRPAVVMVRDGCARQILRRESLDDLDRLEVPDHEQVPEAV